MNTPRIISLTALAASLAIIVMTIAQANVSGPQPAVQPAITECTQAGTLARCDGAEIIFSSLYE